MRERLNFVDNLRGGLILLVILGHCIQGIDADFDHNILFRYIYSFHMPLFMFISGFVSYKVDYQLSAIKKRFLQLVVPFIAWAMLGMTLSGEYSLKWLVYPDKALWFLWVLFWIGCIQIGLSKLSRRMRWAEEAVLAVAAALFLVIVFIGKPIFGIDLIAWYFPFYCLGLITRKYPSILQRLDRYKWVITALFVFTAYFWMRTEPPTFLLSKSAITPLYKYAVGTLGCYTFMLIARLYNHKILYLAELGTMTLGLYAIHQQLLPLLLPRLSLPGPLPLQIAVAFLLTLLLTLLTHALLTRLRPITRPLLPKP